MKRIMPTKEIFHINNRRYHRRQNILSLILIVACLILSYVSVSAQADCVAPNTVNIATTPPDAANGVNGGDFTIYPSNVDLASVGVIDGISLTEMGTPMMSISGNCSSFQDPASLNEVEVWLFVTNNGESSSCSTIVNLIDNAPPQILCNASPINIALDAMEDGEVTITTDDVAQVFENCNLASFDFLSGQQTTFDCMSIGTQTVTLEASDVAGNSVTTQTCTITIVDQTPPVAMCVSTFNYFTSNPNGTLNGQLLATDIDDGSTDNCGVTSLTVTPSTFDCTQVGTVVNVTLTAADAAGNTSTCVSAVSVFDNTPPDLDLYSSNTIFLDEMGMLTFEPEDVDEDTDDNCTGDDDLVWTFDPPMVDCDSLGKTFDLAVTVTDDFFNTSMGTISVTIDDQEDPEAICFMDTMVIALDANGMATLDTMMVDSASTDNCGIYDRSLSQEMFDCTYAGTTVDVTLVVTDGIGNSAINMNTDVCVTPVRIIDTLAPIVVCKLDTVSAGTTIMPDDVTSLIDDNCGITSTTLSMETFDCATVGDNVITVTVEDVNGNITTCTTTVTVLDDDDPIAMAQDINLYLDEFGNGTINPFDANDGSNDNCDNSLNFSVTPMSFDCDDLGVQSATLVVTDDGGNSATASFNVTVMDTLAPVFTVAPFTAEIDATGEVRVAAADFLVSASDNCNISDTLFSLTMNNGYADTLDFDCVDVSSAPIDVYVLLIDDCVTGSIAYSGPPMQGNMDTMMTTLSFAASAPPVAVAKDITIELDDNGEVSISHLDVDDGSTGICGNAISISQSEFDCDDLGDVDITLTVTDAFGTMDATMATVTVVDTTKPVLVLTPLIDTFSMNGSFILDVEDIASYTDNCEGATLTVDPMNFSCEDAGTNQVTVTLTDAGGNVVTGTTTVTLSDVSAPEFTCRDSITISLTNDFDFFGELALDIDQNANRSLGGGGGGFGSFIESDSNEGTQPIVFPGNSNTAGPGDPLLASQIDVMAPSLPANTTIYEAAILLCTASDVFNASYTDVEYVYIHPISGDTLTIEGEAYGCNGYCAYIPIDAQDLPFVGGSTVSLLSVEVVDGDPPLLNSCPSSFISVEYSVSYFEDDFLFTSAPTDNCSPNLIYDFNDTGFNCSDFFDDDPTVLEIDIYDAAGNTESCEINVGFENLPQAVAYLPSEIGIFYLNSDGTLTISYDDIDAGSTVACEDPIFSVSPSTFDCSNIGANTVTLRVENANGDFDEATTTIFIAVNPSFPNPCDPCPETLIVDNDPILNDTYQSSDQLFSSGNVSGANNSNDVIFNSEYKVTLEPGFRSDANANFQVNIKECDTGN